MKKNILIALVCASLILVTPFTVVAQENKIRNNITEEFDVERIVAQIRNRINEKLVKYESKPKLTIFREIILYLLGLFVTILNKILQVIRFIILLPFVFLLYLFIIFFLIG